MPELQQRSERIYAPPLIEAADGTPLLSGTALARLMQRPAHDQLKGKLAQRPVDAAKLRLQKLQQTDIVRWVRVSEARGQTVPYFFTPPESAIALICDEVNAFGLPQLFVRDIAMACRNWGPANPRPEELADDVIPAHAALGAAFESRSYLLTQRVYVDPADPSQRLVATLIRDSELPMPPGVEPGDRWIPRAAFTLELLGLLLPLAKLVFSEPDPSKLQ